MDTKTAALTPVGAGFPSAVVASYDLTGQSEFGFDFNPTTLQADNSIRIRLISTSGANLRTQLRHRPGGCRGYALNIQPGGASPFADASAYINSNKATIGGTTTLFDLDSRNNATVHAEPAQQRAA